LKTAILCGGRGLRMGSDEVPKPMQLVGGRPLIWHIMRWYAKHGHRDFVLLLGWRGDVIRKWVNDLYAERQIDWLIECVDTGIETQTGGRLLRARELLGERFMVTYGDCIADVDIDRLVSFHECHAKQITITIYRPMLPFGVVKTDCRGWVKDFKERPECKEWCNAGFMVMNSNVFDYIKDDAVPLEHALTELSKDGMLFANKHEGFWRGCDTEKDRRELDELWNRGEAPWRVA
jgi:glucose-1-phosphate cytidylyltransferase